jgi:hypothetical protein
MNEVEEAEITTAVKKSSETNATKSKTSTSALPDRKKILIIEGVRENGTKFRPSDWPERISSVFAEFGKDHRLHYAPGVSPRVVNGQKVLAVESSLQQLRPTVFQSVMKFAHDNKLRTREEDSLE